MPEGDYVIPLGVAEIKRPGRDVTVIAHSKMVLVALDAARELQMEGIEVEVIDPRTLRPLDSDALIRSVKKTNRAVIVEGLYHLRDRRSLLTNRHVNTNYVLAALVDNCVDGHRGFAGLTVADD